MIATSYTRERPDVIPLLSAPHFPPGHRLSPNCPGVSVSESSGLPSSHPPHSLLIHYQVPSAFFRDLSENYFSVSIPSASTLRPNCRDNLLF